MSAQQSVATEQTIRLAGIVRESIVDGPGLRFTVFVQGCPHHCPGCHNPQTHDPAGGYDCAVQTLLDAFDENPLLRGVTLSGGEPFEQAAALLPLALAVRARGKDVAAFSGYTIEQLLQKAETDPAVLPLLQQCFLLVDGPFVLQKRHISLQYCGSSNQRLLDVPRTLKAGKPVLWSDGWKTL